MANVKTRIIQKHDSSANWAKATTFVPLKGEIIIYDDLGKVKIGDGATKVNDLQFLDKDAVKQVKLNNVAKTPNADGIVDLGTVITSHQDISGKQDKLNAAQLNAANSGITNAKVKQYDGYNSTIGNHTTRITSLEGKPGLDKIGTVVKVNNTAPDASGNVLIPIPAAVSEATVSGWGFTKNTGTYSKPSGGIPKTDLASAVQTSLNNADNAVKKVKINGAEKSPTNGTADLGNILPMIIASDYIFVTSYAWTADVAVDLFNQIKNLGLKQGDAFILNDKSDATAFCHIGMISSTSATIKALMYRPNFIDKYAFTVPNSVSGTYKKTRETIYAPVDTYDSNTSNPVSGKTLYADLAKKQDKITENNKLSYNLLTDTPDVSSTTAELDTIVFLGNTGGGTLTDEQITYLNSFTHINILKVKYSKSSTDCDMIFHLIREADDILYFIGTMNQIRADNCAFTKLSINLSGKTYSFVNASNKIVNTHGTVEVDATLPTSVFDNFKNNKTLQNGIKIFDTLFWFQDTGNYDSVLYHTAAVSSSQLLLTTDLDYLDCVLNLEDGSYTFKNISKKDFVGIYGQQTIEGAKTFSNDVVFNNVLKGQGDTAYIKLDSSAGQDATTLEIYPDGTFGFLFANGDMGDYFKLPSINNPDYDKNDPYILATTYDIRGTYEVFKRTNMTSTSYSTNWTIKSNTTLPEGAKLVMQISSGPYSVSADNMINKSVFIWNIPYNWNSDQTSVSFETETSTSSSGGSLSIDGGVRIIFSVYGGKTDIILKGRNANSTPGKVEFWTYK